MFDCCVVTASIAVLGAQVGERERERERARGEERTLQGERKIACAWKRRESA
jgi:hypothetical protein